jgi:hypothetical protein
MKVNLTISIPVWLDRLFACPLLLYRLWKYGFPFRRIPLGDGLFTILEPQDYYLAGNFHWVAKKNRQCIYVYRFINSPGRKTKMVLLHRMIMNSAGRLLVDHKNGDTLDNRRANLRLATRAQNAWNTRRDKSKTSSQFIGVTFDKNRGLWAPRIRYQGKRIYLGRFKNEIDAARAYDEAARKYHGEFALLNFSDR